jgi:hypothetical protein
MRLIGLEEHFIFEEHFTFDGRAECGVTIRAVSPITLSVGFRFSADSPIRGDPPYRGPTR